MNLEKKTRITKDIVIYENASWTASVGAERRNVRRTGQ